MRRNTHTHTSTAWDVDTLEDGWCMELNIVILSFANALRVITNEFAAVESNPEVGSSNNSTLGLVNNSVPILHRFFSPPLRTTQHEID